MSQAIIGNKIRASKGKVIKVENAGLDVDDQVVVNNQNQFYIDIDLKKIKSIHSIDNVGLVIKNADDNTITKIISGSDSWLVGVDNSTGAIRIAKDDFSTPSLEIDASGLLKLLNGVGVDSILDEDLMTSDDANALATQQSIKAYVDDSVSVAITNVIGKLDDDITYNIFPETTIYGRVISATWNDGDYTISIPHGISNALTNERILSVNVNVVSGSGIRQVSSADVSYPELSYYDNTNVVIQRASNANTYDVFVMLIYK